MAAATYKLSVSKSGFKVATVDGVELNAGVPATVNVKLDLGQTKVAGLKGLAELEGLQTLKLGQTKVTDVGLKELATLRNLQSLNLGFARVTDLGLRELASLQKLEVLNLCFTQDGRRTQGTGRTQGAYTP